MTDPGSGASPSGSQPGTPGGAPQGTWTPPPPATPVAQPEKKGLKKVLPLVGSIAAAGIVGVGALTGGFGLGDPEVGDCVQMQGDTSFDVVDCGSGDAESRIVGVEEQEMNYAEFMADDSACSSFEKTEYVLWVGELETEPGTVYCTEPV